MLMSKTFYKINKWKDFNYFKKQLHEVMQM